MITCYDKIGFNPHATLARIVGELNMDYVPVTHDKRDFLRDSEQFIEIDTVLRINPEFRAMQQRARTPHKEPKKTDPMKVAEVDDIDDRQEKSIGEVLRSVVRIKLDDRCPVCDAVLPNLTPLCARCGSTTGLSDSGNASFAGEDQNVSSIKVEIEDRNVDVQHTFADLGSYGPMFKADDSSTIVRVTTNASFPAYRSMKDGRFFAALNICIALAQLAKKQDRLTFNEWVRTQERLLLHVPQIMRALQDLEGNVGIQKPHGQEPSSKVVVAAIQPQSTSGKL